MASLPSSLRTSRAARLDRRLKGKQEGSKDQADLSQKIRDGLSEARIIVLGAQVLTGASFELAFQEQYDKLPPLLKDVQVSGLALMLVVLMLLMLPAPYHEISEQGEDTKALREFVSKSLELALAPFAMALGALLFSITQPAVGPIASVVLAIGGVLTALTWWYGIEIAARRKLPLEERFTQMEAQEKAETPLPEKISQLLTEARVVLPGAQALLGFQFIAILSQTFSKLPESSKLMHIGSLAAIALTTMMLMTPPAYHRIVENGESTERFKRFATRVILLAMVPLALGLSGDFFVVLRIVTESVPLSVFSAALMLLMFLGGWFGLTGFIRLQHDRLQVQIART